MLPGFAMAEPKSELVRTTEKRVREIFAAARHKIVEVVGERPGEVVFFAEDPRRTARLLIHWVVWERCPEDFDAALEALDQESARLGADRAIAVIAQGNLPDGYRHDLHGRHVNAFTVRRLMFELLGVFEFLRSAAAPPTDAPHHPSQFLLRRGVTEDGGAVSAVEHIEDILDREGPWLLLIDDEEGLGRHTLLSHVVYRRARACLANSEQGTPLLIATTATGARWSAAARDALAPEVAWYADERYFRWLLKREEARPFHKCASVAIDHPGLERWTEGRQTFSLRLLAPDEHELRAWYRSHLPEPAYAQLDIAWEQSRDIAAIVRHLPNLEPVRMAAIHATNHSDTPQAWVARFVIHYVHRAAGDREDDDRTDGRQSLVELLEDAALEEFALGRSSRAFDIFHRIEHTPMAQWFATDAQDPAAGRFANRLVRDYFLARKIAAEARAHGPDIFARYQFPQDHVLLFLAVIAPEIAAQATADRSIEMRAHIREEIEHQLQLTLAHQLKRSVGALRTNVSRVRRALTEAVRTECHEDLERIADELQFLSELAEKTRRWHEVPEERDEDISMLTAIDGVLSQLRNDHGEVELLREIAPDVIVRARRHTLHEILYCLLENACHAACDPAATRPPRVEVRAIREGTSVVRIEVLDSGPGVDPGDRERIFEPRVTTKKGGPGRPLGTGMGLAIARKYASAIGGRVELDPERPQTCFVLKLVAGGMNRG